MTDVRQLDDGCWGVFASDGSFDMEFEPDEYNDAVEHAEMLAVVEKWREVEAANKGKRGR